MLHFLSYFQTLNRTLAAKGCDSRISSAVQILMLRNLIIRACHGDPVDLCKLIFPATTRNELEPSIVEMKKKRFLIRCTRPPGTDRPYLIFSLNLYRFDLEGNVNETCGLAEYQTHLWLECDSHVSHLKPIISLSSMDLEFWYEFLLLFPNRIVTDVLGLDLGHVFLGLEFPFAEFGQIYIGFRGPFGVLGFTLKYYFDARLPNLSPLALVLKKFNHPMHDGLSCISFHKEMNEICNKSRLHVQIP